MSINDVSREIPPYFLEKGLDHFSPSQGTMPIDQWVFKYWYSNQKQRRQFKGNSKMNSGVSVGDAVDNYFTKGEITKSLKLYVPYDEKDADQLKQDKESYMPTLENTIRAYEKLGIKQDGKNVFEHYVNLQPEGVAVPIIGRTDLQNDDIVIELKTKWRRRGALKKDGTRGYSAMKPPTSPDSNHLKQASFYHLCTKLPTYIVYATEKDAEIIDIRDYNYKNAFDEMVRSLIIKSRIASQKDPHLYVDVDWSHFAWDIGDEHLKRAKELFYGS